MPEDSSSSASSSSSYSSNPSSSTSAGSGTSTGGTGKLPRANKAILAALTKAEQINLVAGKTEYAALAAREITAPVLTQQAARIAQARVRSGEAISGTVQKEGTTQAETEARTLLLACLSEMCTAAKQRFGRSNPTHLQNYRIGAKWQAMSRADLEQYALDVINKAAADNLPGITPAKVETARQRREAYVQANLAQTTAQGDATGSRLSLSDLMKQVTDTRIAIQLAADAEWPHTNAANAGIRAEFRLPARSKFKG